MTTSCTGTSMRLRKRIARGGACAETTRWGHGRLCRDRPVIAAVASVERVRTDELTRERGNVMTRFMYESPVLIDMGRFADNTAGFGRFFADQLVGRLIP